MLTNQQRYEAGRTPENHSTLPAPLRAGKELPPLPKPAKKMMRQDLLALSGSGNMYLHGLWERLHSICGDPSRIEQVKNAIKNGTYGACPECLEEVHDQQKRHQALVDKWNVQGLTYTGPTPPTAEKAFLSLCELFADPAKNRCDRHNALKNKTSTPA